ncbi:MAG: type I-G CRISPR-associated helicase/endonuclease Cas3g, partial [Candidatus Hadarchaeum sp.]|uniref:type I-G CRISPR-associated helicase/endonuclease Cas3g n=1 Tax=Candidatus Hadarchaeum sp. TaxID=2883567 RepID=UPI003D0D0C1D
MARRCAVSDPPLAISTLRGQFADNGEWREDPSRPAIVVGTVDMVGSKLLFAGFGDSRRRRATHAGLLGQDTLIVHDEAHLDPAFAELLARLKQLQHKETRPIRVIFLSASLRSQSGEIFCLTDKDRNHNVIQQRITAQKILHLHETSAKTVSEKITEIALGFAEQKKRVLVFIRSPEEAQEKVAARLVKALKDSTGERVALLTGTMRGYERDELLKANPVLRAFFNGDVQQSVYLVATSAGEVGIDLDADHLVTDLPTLDSLLQRLGRVNRRGGEGRRAEVHVVLPDTIEDKDPLKVPREATMALLAKWNREHDPCDLSPANLETFLNQLTPEERQQAFSPVPKLAFLTDIHLDFLAATSLSRPPLGAPNLAQVIHGVEPEEPEVHLFWRQELSLLQGVGPETLRRWFELCPPSQRELVRLSTRAAKKLLEKRAKQLGERAASLAAAVLTQSTVFWLTLSELLEAPDSDLDFSFIALPVEIGGLNPQTGAVDASAEGPVQDVAEGSAQRDPDRIRVLECVDEGLTTYFTLRGESWPNPGTWDLLGSVTLEHDPEGEPLKSLCLFLPRRETSREDAEHAGGQLTIEEHSEHVEKWVQRLAKALELPEEFEEALTMAAQIHDRGKEHRIWQFFACAEKEPKPLAKAKQYRSPRVLGGFRHELASLRFFHPRDDGLATRLARHLIAAHHGWARPHFPPDARDPEIEPRKQKELEA